ncbi:MAG: hypothetical protein ACKV19_29470 [Verrucomicrobiales bacterium]
MPTIRKLVSSFNAGELSPLMAGRLGVEKLDSGCRLMRNFIPHVHGPVFRRGGFEFMGMTQGPEARSRLIPFNFSTTTNFILELHPAGLAVWQSGGKITLVNPVALPYSENELFEIQFVQVNDVVYLSHPTHWPRRLVRYADNDWRLEPLLSGLDDSSVTSGYIETGPFGRATLSKWPVADGVYIANPDTDDLIAAITANPPASVEKTTTLKQPNAPANVSQKLEFEFVPPATGTWVIEYQASGRFIVDGGVKDTHRSPAARSFSMTLNAGQRYSCVHWRFSGSSTPGTVPFVVIVTGPGYSRRYVPAEWFKDLDLAVPGTYSQSDWRNLWPPVLDENVTPGAVTPSGTTGTITLTADDDIFQAGHVGSYWQIAHRRTVAHTELVGAVGAFSGSSSALRVLGPWDLFTYGTWEGTLALERKTPAGGWEAVRTWNSNKDRNVIANGVADTEETYRLTVTGGDGEAATGAAVPRFVLECADAKVYGLVKITAFTAADEVTATVVRPLYSTSATTLWSEGAWSAVQGFPRAIGLHEQRLFFAGTRRNPQRVWGSTSADFENFRRATLDDGSLDFTLAAQEANAIQWIASQGALIIGTAGEEWTVDANGTDAPLTPTNLKVNRQSRFGSAYLQAQLVNEVAVFAQRTGRKLRQFQYSESTDGYTAADLTVLAEHITAGGIVQMAFQSQKQSILWAVTGDGRLIGMTFEKEQNVFAWHAHDMFGVAIESVAVIYGDPVDEVWVTGVRDPIGGDTRMVFRLDPLAMNQNFSRPERLNYMDQSRVFEFESPTDTIGDLTWLNGRTVDVLVDGATHPSVSVVDDTITLERAGSVIVVGFSFFSTLQPMPFEVPVQSGSAQGMAWKLNRLALRLYESSGGEAAEAPTVDPEDWEEIHPRDPGDAMDAAVPLFTGEKRLTLSAASREELSLTIRQRLPLPLNVASIVQIFDVHDR